MHTVASSFVQYLNESAQVPLGINELLSGWSPGV